MSLAARANEIQHMAWKLQYYNTPFQRNYIIARDQKCDLHGTSFQSSPKINRMLITRPICILNDSLQHPTIAVFKKRFLFFFDHSVLVPKFSTISSDRIRALTLFRKALDSIFPKLSSQNMRGFDHQRFLVPVSTVSPRNAWHNGPFVYKIRRKTRCRLWVSLLTQARLINSNVFNTWRFNQTTQ